jgi:hypothetical protein
MGQYYSPVLVDPDTGKMTAYELDEGYKLMEHVRCGDAAVRGIMSLLEKPMRVFWMGDYAMSLPWDHNTPTGERLVHMAEASKVADDRDARKEIPKPVKDNALLLNLDKQLCVVITDNWLHPLPILTACGNGNGGGDYYGTSMELVGSWEGDLLQAVDLMPDGFTPLDVAFEEERG